MYYFGFCQSTLRQELEALAEERRKKEAEVRKKDVVTILPAIHGMVFQVELGLKSSLVDKQFCPRSKKHKDERLYNYTPG